MQIDLNGVKNNASYYNFFVIFGNWILIFTNFVPISLLVTLEMVKFFQAILIAFDKNMSYKFIDESNKE